MRNKNGFIATSVLYAFLVAFLTLFLAFMASYIQNKQLINRIEEMAREELEKYGNTKISNMEIGDVVIFDTIDNVSDGISTEVKYSAPINPSSKWILYKIDTTSDDKNDLYYFVSSADAQKSEPLATATYDFDINEGPKYNEILNIRMHSSDLETASKIINGNVFYDSASQEYRSYDSSVTSISKDGYKKVYSYQFMYTLNDGIDVRFMTNADFQVIDNIANEKIKEAIYNQKTDYTIWKSKDDPYGETDTEMNKEGFYSIGYKMMTPEDNNKPAVVSNFCSSKVGYQHEVSMSGYDHYYDYCYYVGDYIGTCTDSSNNKCARGITHNPRFVATVKVSKTDASTDGYAESGNGTYALPYLIIRGTKK